MMDDLKKQQEIMQSVLLDPSLSCPEFIQGDVHLSSDARLAVYQNAVHIRLHDALSANFPILHQVMGGDAFWRLTEQYIHEHPSTFKSIRWFGDELPDFILSHVTITDSKWLSELATFEWLQTCAFDAHDAAPLTIETIASVAPEEWVNVRLHPHPSVQRMAFSHNVVALWQAMQDGKARPDIVQSDEPVQWIIWREHYLNRFCSLPPDEARYLDILISGGTFYDVLQVMNHHMPVTETPQWFASLLKGWLQVGLFVQFTIHQE